MNEGRLSRARAISHRRRSPPDSASEGDFRSRVNVELLQQVVQLLFAALALRLHSSSTA